MSKTPEYVKEKKYVKAPQSVKTGVCERLEVHQRRKFPKNITEESHQGRNI